MIRMIKASIIKELGMGKYGEGHKRIHSFGMGSCRYKGLLVDLGVDLGRN